MTDSYFGEVPHLGASIPSAKMQIEMRRCKGGQLSISPAPLRTKDSPSSARDPQSRPPLWRPVQFSNILSLGGSDKFRIKKKKYGRIQASSF